MCMCIQCRVGLSCRVFSVIKERSFVEWAPRDKAAATGILTERALPHCVFVWSPCGGTVALKVLSTFLIVR